MILHPLVKTSPHTINNATTFLTNIKDLKLEPDEIMISFDVVSLFTSIPLDTSKTHHKRTVYLRRIVANQNQTRQTRHS